MSEIIRGGGANRLKWVDACKGIAVFCVILGHQDLDPFLKRFIYTFHMPLFFVLSGLFFSSVFSNSFKEILIKRFFTLLVPFALFNLFWYVPFYELKSYIMPQSAYSQDVVGHIGGVFLATREDWWLCSYLWFLPAMFSATLLLWGCVKYAPRYWLWASLFICIIGLIYAKFIHRSLPFSVDIACIAVMFIALGYVFKNYFYEVSWRVAIVGLICSFAAAIYNTRVDMAGGVYGNYLLFILGSIGGCLFFIRLSKYLENCKILRIGGELLMIIYILHFSVNGFFSAFARFLPFYDTVGIKSVVCFCVSCCVFIAIIPIGIVFRRFIPWAVGIHPARKGNVLYNAKA